MPVRATLRRLGIALAAATLASAAAASLATAAVTVHLSPEVTVSAPELLLGDLGPVEGDRALAERVRAVRLGVSPTPGSSYRVDIDHILVRLRQHRIEPTTVHLVGPGRVSVTRSYQTLTGQAVLEAAAGPALERLQAAAPTGAPYSLVPLMRPADLRLPTGALELAPRVQEPTPPYAMMLASVAVRVEGHDHQVIPVSFRVARLVTVVVAAQPLEPNRVLGLADFRLEARPSTEVPATALAALEDAADVEATRSIRRGEIITRSHLRPRILVHRGERVTLLLEGRGFRVTTVGLAAEDARRGDLVRVVNPTSKREVQGRVEAAGLVRVNP
jgi:flagella basal body P-ring formation protein FlgA